MQASPTELAPDDPGGSRRAMFRRLWGYLAQNRGRYALGAFFTLSYVGGFVVVPLLVGWSIQAVADGLPVAEVGRRAAILPKRVNAFPRRPKPVTHSGPCHRHAIETLKHLFAGVLPQASSQRGPTP